jgi:hypothetical protein
MIEQSIRGRSSSFLFILQGTATNRRECYVSQLTDKYGRVRGSNLAKCDFPSGGTQWVEELNWPQIPLRIDECL